MNTEITDKKAKDPGGWIFYDDECPLCLRWAGRVKRLLNHRTFNLVPLQTPWAKERLDLAESGQLTEMRILLADGRTFGGADAVMEIARQIWWAWPAWAISRIPGVMLFCRAIYRFIANHRECGTNACVRKNRRAWLDWIPLVLLPVAVFPLRDLLPAWIFMWAFVTAIFFGCKWLTWRRAQIRFGVAGALRTIGYFFAWPGMDVKTFLTCKPLQPPKVGQWLLGFGRFFAGAIIVWSAANGTLSRDAVVNAWLGMFGLTLILHFGLFHLVALAWQRAGVAAEPLMKSPLASTSLADFWGARWNTAFNKLVNDLAFRPLQRRGGAVLATLVVFAISGVIHEISISLPARGGYGFPLAYFLLQGAGVLIQRSPFGRAIGLGSGLRGWIFMAVFTAAPAYWLFHPVFVRNVILPMLQAIGTN